MVPRLLLLVVLLTFLQITNSWPSGNSKEVSPIQKAIEEINPEFDRITQQLKKLKIEINIGLLKASAKIHKTITEDTYAILNEVDGLQQTFANENTTMSRDCLKSKSIQLDQILFVINMKTNKFFDDSKLYMNNITEKSNAVLRDIDLIDKNIFKVIGYCVKYNLPWKEKQLSECLHNETNILNRAVNDLYKQIPQSNDTKFIDNIRTDQKRLLQRLSTIKALLQICVSRPSNLNEPSNVNESSNVEEKEEKSDNSGNILERVKAIEAFINQLKPVNKNTDFAQQNFAQENFAPVAQETNPIEIKRNITSILYITFS